MRSAVLSLLLLLPLFFLFDGQHSKVLENLAMEDDGHAHVTVRHACDFVHHSSSTPRQARRAIFGCVFAALAKRGARVIYLAWALSRPFTAASDGFHRSYAAHSVRSEVRGASACIHRRSPSFFVKHVSCGAVNSTRAYAVHAAPPAVLHELPSRRA